MRTRLLRSWELVLLVLAGGATSCATARGGAMERPSTDQQSQAPDAEVHVSPTQSEVHTYLLAHGSDAEMGQCTGPCTLHIPAGTYRVAAGFTHAELTKAPARLVLEPGQNVNVDVRVGGNVAKGALFGTAAAGFLGLLAADVVVMAKQDELLSGPKTPLTRGLSFGTLGFAAAMAFIQFAMDDPLVSTNIKQMGGSP